MLHLYSLERAGVFLFWTSSIGGDRDPWKETKTTAFKHAFFFEACIFALVSLASPSQGRKLEQFTPLLLREYPQREDRWGFWGTSNRNSGEWACSGQPVHNLPSKSFRIFPSSQDNRPPKKDKKITQTMHWLLGSLLCQPLLHFACLALGDYLQTSLRVKIVGCIGVATQESCILVDKCHCL